MRSDKKGKGTSLSWISLKASCIMPVEEEVGRSRVVPLDVQTVWQILEMQEKGNLAEDLFLPYGSSKMRLRKKWILRMSLLNRTTSIKKEEEESQNHG